MALSTSPPVSSSARLQSMNPAPVRSRSSLTASAVIAMPVVLLCRGSGAAASDGVCVVRDGTRAGGGPALLGGLGDRAGLGRAAAREQVVVLELGIERERPTCGELGDEVGRRGL